MRKLGGGSRRSLSGGARFGSVQQRPQLSTPDPQEIIPPALRRNRAPGRRRALPA